MKRPTAQRVDGVEAVLHRIPVPAELVDKALATLLATGRLPDEPRFATQVADRLEIDSQAPIESGSSIYEWGRRLWERVAERDRARDAVRDALIHEAIWETGIVRLAARGMLQGLVAAGFDLRQAIFDGDEVPEFGPVGLALLGFPEQFVGPEFAAQCRRLDDRCDILARAIPHGDPLWRRSMRTAAELFQCYGERPADPLVLECVLALGELSTFVAEVAGLPVDDELAAFDAAFMATGDEREQAITRLQDMAIAGRFVPEVR